MKTIRLTHEGMTIRFTWREVTKLRVFINFFRLNNGDRYSRGETIFAAQLNTKLREERENYERERKHEREDANYVFGTVYERAIRKSLRLRDEVGVSPCESKDTK